MTMASDAQKEYMRQYYIRTKEARLSYKKEHYKETKEQHQQKCSEYHKNNRDKIVSRKRELYSPEKRRALLLKKNYNLTIEEYDTMYLAQKGCCALCGKHSSLFKKGLAVDHNHQTGQIRGLLCGICNTGLAVYEEHRSKVSEYLASYERT